MECDRTADFQGPEHKRSKAFALAFASVLLAYSGSGGGNPAAAASTPPAPAVPPAWVSPLAVGQWHPIPNTALASVAPSPTPDGGTGPRSKVETWTSFVVDTRTSKVYSVANGGHGDYS